MPARYRIVGTIVLGFLTAEDSQDVLLDEGVLELEGGTLYLVNDLGRHESHTEAGAVAAWVAMGLLEPEPAAQGVKVTSS